MEYQHILEEIHTTLQNSPQKGTVASYIPELGKVNADHLGIYLFTLDGKEYGTGHFDIPFSVQSISKVLSLAKALDFVGTDLWKRVDVEPSGNPFNFLTLLELEKGIPRNPFINAGALVISDILLSHLKNPKEDFLNYVRELAEDSSISYNEDVAASEKATGYRNTAAANLLKSFGNMEHNVEDVLDFYFYQCSLSMNCRQLARTFYVFANSGKNVSGKTFLPPGLVKRINAIMLTCGFYDEAGEFAFEVGLPGKSGVGGGIVAVLPGNYCISTWAPGLNEKGNSLLGMQALEMFTTKTKLSIF
ncbi:glutaminase [Sinomicrobium weinanense]|uniref:Glutaminase n=1 Tax=Sinomicrobium weinanense TaxID=2842200 RepID=A0A926JSI0_9FLAO|nr:glutaminase [Sinomicrobium weinanense]MBC9796386.1 glutaminase [Sinomicrobium weinanense]MBU3122613.1 glutaminase [Sinomicrobium weinanense]